MNDAQDSVNSAKMDLEKALRAMKERSGTLGNSGSSVVGQKRKASSLS
jgi:hypothetical protein